MYDAISLERGATHHQEFEQCPNGVRNFGAGLGSEASARGLPQDVIIEVYNEAGRLAVAYRVFRCRVSNLQSLPDLDANANAVAIQYIKLENEGWNRDYEVPDPTEPAFVEPPPMSRCGGLARRHCWPTWERGSLKDPLDRALTLPSAAGPVGDEIVRGATCETASLLATFSRASQGRRVGLHRLRELRNAAVTLHYQPRLVCAMLVSVRTPNGASFLDAYLVAERRMPSLGRDGKGPPRLEVMLFGVPAASQPTEVFATRDEAGARLLELHRQASRRPERPR